MTSVMANAGSSVFYCLKRIGVIGYVSVVVPCIPLRCPIGQDLRNAQTSPSFRNANNRGDSWSIAAESFGSQNPIYLIRPEAIGLEHHFGPCWTQPES